MILFTLSLNPHSFVFETTPKVLIPMKIIVPLVYRCGTLFALLTFVSQKKKKEERKKSKTKELDKLGVRKSDR